MANDSIFLLLPHAYWPVAHIALQVSKQVEARGILSDWPNVRIPIWIRPVTWLGREAGQSGAHQLLHGQTNLEKHYLPRTTYVVGKTLQLVSSLTSDITVSLNFSSSSLDFLTVGRSVQLAWEENWPELERPQCCNHNPAGMTKCLMIWHLSVPIVLDYVILEQKSDQTVLITVHKLAHTSSNHLD